MYAKQKLAVYLNKSVSGDYMSVNNIKAGLLLAIKRIYHRLFEHIFSITNSTLWPT
ncbi:MAG: hypothetical protein JWR02_3120 [Mucilaginibacter sp.]|nr:hypothetical protein [Mucilaginibacter sp.]